MSRNPIARHLRQHRHQVVTDKRGRNRVSVDAEEIVDGVIELSEPVDNLTVEARFDATKSDGTNYD